MVAQIYVWSPAGLPELDLLPGPYEKMVMLTVFGDEKAGDTGDLHIFISLDCMNLPQTYWDHWLENMRTPYLYACGATDSQRYALSNIARAYHTFAFLEPNRSLYAELTHKFRVLQATTSKDIDATEKLFAISVWIDNVLGAMPPISDKPEADGDAEENHPKDDAQAAAGK